MHDTGLEALLDARRRSGVTRLVQISAAGAAPGVVANPEPHTALGYGPAKGLEATLDALSEPWVLLSLALYLGAGAFWPPVE